MIRNSTLLAASLVLSLAAAAQAIEIAKIPSLSPSLVAPVAALKEIPAQTPLKDLKFAAMDMETLGFWPEVHPLIEVGAAKFQIGEGGRAVVSNLHHSFVDPHAPVPANITGLTGITQEMVKGAPEARPAIRSLERFVADVDVLMAHSAFFDTQYVVANGFGLGTPVVDTKALARGFFGKEGTGMAHLAGRYGVKEHPDHRAHHDAASTAPIFAGLLGTLAQKLGKPVEALTWGDLSAHANVFYGPKVYQEAFAAKPGDPTKADLDVSTPEKKQALWEEIHRVQFELFKAGKPNSLRSIARAMGVSYDALVAASQGIPTKIH